MILGDKIHKSIELGKEAKAIHEGTVVYIHPKFRFYMLEFDLNGGKVRECYFPQLKPQAEPKPMRCFY